MEGAEPSAKAFAATHQATQRPLNSLLGDHMWLSYMCVTLRPREGMEHVVPTKVYKDHWGKTMFRKWFYYDQDPNCNLHSLRTEIRYIGHPEIAMDDQLQTRLDLLQRIARKASMRDLCKEFFAAGIMPLRRDWGSLFTPDATTRTRSFNINQLPGN